MKMTIVTRYGSFEFLVILFPLCIAPNTFCALMNGVLHPFLNKFVSTYIDDIIVYRKNMEEK